MVSGRALKAEGRGIRRRVLADGAALALIEAKARFELALRARLLLLSFNIRQVKPDDRRHWARGSQCARCNEARRALGSACQARLAGELPVPPCGSRYRLEVRASQVLNGSLVMTILTTLRAWSLATSYSPAGQAVQTVARMLGPK